MNIEPVIILTNRCNHKCIFCSRRENDSLQKDSERLKIMKEFKDTVTFEGGEPMLAFDLLLKWVAYAKKQKIKERMLVTNGFGLDDEKKVKMLLDSGINVFNINLPSHNEKIYKVLTSTLNYQKVINAIKTIIKIAGSNSVRLTFVINKLNYMTIYNYLNFIKQEFNNVFYVEINMIKIRGKVKERLWLVPRLKNIRKFLLYGFNTAKDLGIKVISDGIPLCYMKGYEHLNVDVYNNIFDKNKWNREKQKVEICKKCVLNKICSGPRKDYIKLFGKDEIVPIIDKKYYDEVIKRIL